MNKPSFITVEGGEGSGKTSLLRHLSSWCHEHHIPYLLTREPGGTAFGESIREMLLHHASTGICPLSELLLFLAARVEHVEHVIRPHLQQGVTVICDRYIDSTMAYQAYGRELDIEMVWELSCRIVPLLPDLTLYLDLPSTVGFQRILSNRKEERDRLESEHATFHERVHEGFLSMAKRCQDRIVLLDASQDEQTLARSAQKILADRLGVGRPCI